MTFIHIVLLMLYSLGMVTGQLLFKLTANAKPSAPGPVAFALGLVTSPAFIAAIGMYFALSLFWVWLLSQVPLSKAYPFVAISFVLTALSGIVFFGERISSLNALGLVLIAAGVTLVAR